MHSHLPSCWVVLYLTTWWPPSPWRLILASFALFHFCLGRRGWRWLARPTRPLQGSDLRAYLALLWFATRAHEMHLKPSVPLALMRWGPHILSSPSPRVGRWHLLAQPWAWLRPGPARGRRAAWSWVLGGSVAWAAARILSWMSWMASSCRVLRS